MRHQSWLPSDVENVPDFRCRPVQSRYNSLIPLPIFTQLDTNPTLRQMSLFCIIVPDAGAGRSKVQLFYSLSDYQILQNPTLRHSFRFSRPPPSMFRSTYVSQSRITREAGAEPASLVYFWRCPGLLCSWENKINDDLIWFWILNRISEWRHAWDNLYICVGHA